MCKQKEEKKKEESSPERSCCFARRASSSTICVTTRPHSTQTNHDTHNRTCKSSLCNRQLRAPSRARQQNRVSKSRVASTQEPFAPARTRASTKRRKINDLFVYRTCYVEHAAPTKRHDRSRANGARRERERCVWRRKVARRRRLSLELVRCNVGHHVGALRVHFTQPDECAFERARKRQCEREKSQKKRNKTHDNHESKNRSTTHQRKRNGLGTSRAKPAEQIATNSATSAIIFRHNFF